jgi:hypothetical protein
VIAAGCRRQPWPRRESPLTRCWATLALYRITPGHVLHVTGVISPESVRCLVGRACSKGLLAVEIWVDRRRYQAVALNTKNSRKQA